MLNSSIIVFFDSCFFVAGLVLILLQYAPFYYVRNTRVAIGLIYLLLAAVLHSLLILAINSGTVSLSYWVENYQLVYLAFGPFLFLWVKTIIKSDKKNWKTFLHFVPVFFSLGLKQLAPAWFQATPGSVVGLIAVASFGIYFVLSLHSLKNYTGKEIQIVNYRKPGNGVLRIIYTSMALCVSSVILIYCTDPWFSMYLFVVQTIMIGAFFCVKMLSTKSVKKHPVPPLSDIALDTVPIFCVEEKLDTSVNNALLDIKELQLIEGQRKYNKSGLCFEKKIEYVSQLIYLLETEKLYLDRNLSLATLAERLQISTNHLSQTINEHLQISFLNLINGYRISEVKKQLSNPEKTETTIIAIAMESGFSSKAAFNAAFKKNTGVTPSEYKAKLHVKVIK